MLIFLWSLYWTKYVFIYLEVATDRWSSIKELHQFYIGAKQIKIYPWKCFDFIKVAGSRPETLSKLDFFTGKLDTLYNKYFEENLEAVLQGVL